MQTRLIEQTEALAGSARELLRALILDPDTHILDVSVKIVETARFDSPQKRTCYIVRITTNDSSMVMGVVDAFKGSYKERVEGALNATLNSVDEHAEVAVDIIGPPGSTVEKLVPLERMQESGRIPADSPIVKIAQEFGIPYVLIRGRHLIGPNPAIALSLTALLESGLNPEIALDLFSGTGVAAKVISRRVPLASITVVELDPAKVKAMRGHLRGNQAQILTADAFRFGLQQRFDLVVADPYYEDCLSFLRLRGLELRECTDHLLLVGGRIEHESWNEKIYKLLSECKFRVRTEALYGQTVFMCT